MKTILNMVLKVIKEWYKKNPFQMMSGILALLTSSQVSPPLSKTNEKCILKNKENEKLKPELKLKKKGPSKWKTNGSI